MNDSLVIVYSYINNSWKFCSSNKPDNLNSLKELKLGYGYFVKVSEDVRWEFDETNLYFVLSSIVEDYFPLNVGNSWTYVNSDDGSTKTFTVIGTEEINGYTYYKFDDYSKLCNFPGYPPNSPYPPEDNDVLFRYDPSSDKVLQYWPSRNEDVIRYDFSGNKYGDGGNQLIETGINYTVSVGEFDNCLKFQFAIDMWCGYFSETLAPSVGNIEFITQYDGKFELQSYTIVP